MVSPDTIHSSCTRVQCGPRSRISQPVRGVGYEPGVSVTPEPMRDAITTRGNESTTLRPASTAISGRPRGPFGTQERFKNHPTITVATSHAATLRGVHRASQRYEPKSSRTPVGWNLICGIRAKVYRHRLLAPYLELEDTLVSG